MQTVFVINEETGKVMGHLNLEYDAEVLIYSEIEEFENGSIETTLKYPIKQVDLGDAYANVIVVDDAYIAENIINAEAWEYETVSDLTD
jgi:hypothetical protein